MAECRCLSHNGFLTSRGREVAQQLSLEGLTPLSDSVRVDIPVSVSASMGPLLHWDDALLEEQYRRFHNGS